MIFRRFLLCSAHLALISLVLAGCGTPSEEQEDTLKKHPRHARAHHETQTQAQTVQPPAILTADTYLLHLSLAKLALAGQTPDTVAAASHLATISAYDGQKRRSPFFQPAIILTYKTSGHRESQHVLAPFAMPQDSHDFPALVTVLNALAATPYTLQDIEPGVVVINETDVPLPQASPGQTERSLDQRLLLLSQSPGVLPPLEQAQLQMQLTRFFMERRMRDAAYLCLDNARRSLSRISDGTAGSDTVRDLTRRLDTLEDQLHKAMPFSLTEF